MAVLRISFSSASFLPGSTRSETLLIKSDSITTVSLHNHSVLKQFAHLPVTTILQQLTDALTKGHAVLSSPTGSGKTTLAPLALLESPTFSTGKILMLEPRRIAARAAAVRMSTMLGEKVGTTIGYRTRDESRISKSTSIEVITEGILIRQLQEDPELTGCNLVIFDEFHERSLQADLGLALCLDLCQLRDDLRLLVMSATLQPEELCTLLDDAPYISSNGRSYPVEISYLPPLDERTPIDRQMVRGVMHAWKETNGDILAFLPGAGEIHNCRQLLQGELPESLILPLYGSLSHDDQDRIFRHDNERRRIILATPVAETSITIENISSVVDSGYCRRPIHDHTSGLSRLATFRISKSSAAQRAGRAGRTGPGHCFRLWGKEADFGLLEQTPPEIVNGDLTSLILELALWGVTDPAQLCWLNPPRQSSWLKTVQLLQRLTLLDDEGKITQHGREVASLPVHPRLGIILTKAAKLSLCWTACLVAAVLTDRDIFAVKSKSSDIEERVRVLACFADKHATLPPHADRALCRRLLSYAKKWFSRFSDSRDQTVFTEEIGNLLAFGFPDRIAKLRDNSSYRYQLDGGHGVELPPADILSNSNYLVAPQLDLRQGNGRIFLAAQLSIDDIEKHHSHLLQEKERVIWDKTLNKVIAKQNSYLGNIIVGSKPLKHPDSELVSEVFLEGVRQCGPELLPWTSATRELQARMTFLHCWQPDKWPDVSDIALLDDLAWLTPYCSHMRSIEQLQELNFKTILLSMLSWEEQQQLETLTPSHLRVPSGSSVKLEYPKDKQPMLSVRLQEVFGLFETPTICNNQTRVVLHLLSPARRPIQVTSDLQSFWKNTYPEVRKELAGRYPKHYWPEDPLVAKATTKTKKYM